MKEEYNQPKINDKRWDFIELNRQPTISIFSFFLRIPIGLQIKYES